MKNFTVSKVSKGFFVLGVILFFYSCSLNEEEKIDTELTFNQKKAELRTNAKLMGTALRNTFDENKHSELNNVILYSGMKKNFLGMKMDNEYSNSFAQVDAEYDISHGVYPEYNQMPENKRPSDTALKYFKQLSNLFEPGGAIFDFDVYNNLRISGDSIEYTLEEFKVDVQVAVVQIEGEVDNDTTLGEEEKLNLLGSIYVIEENLPVMFDEFEDMFIDSSSGRGLWKWLKKAVKNDVNAVATVVNQIVVNATYFPLILTGAAIGTAFGNPIAGGIIAAGIGGVVGLVIGVGAVINQDPGLYVCVFCVASPTTSACYEPGC